MTRVLLVAESHPDRLGASWARALRELGHDCRLFDMVGEWSKLAWPLRNRYTHRATIRSLAIRRAGSRAFNDAILEAVKSYRPDILAFHNGHFVMPETAARARELAAWVVLFHADNPLPPHAAWRPETLDLARASDCFLIWSEQLAAKLRSLGVSRATVFHFAWDPVAFPYALPPVAPRNEVVFVGNWEPAREALLEVVAAHFPLRIYGGSYWMSRTKRGSRCRTAWAGREVSGGEAANVFRSSAIAINPLREQHVINGQPDGLIMRHFEVPGAGGFLLSTRSSGATELFPETTYGSYFANDEECCERIEYFLSHPRERQAIAAAAHYEVAEKHQYRHRMKELVSLVEDASPLATGLHGNPHDKVDNR